MIKHTDSWQPSTEYSSIWGANLLDNGRRLVVPVGNCSERDWNEILLREDFQDK